MHFDITSQKQKKAGHKMANQAGELKYKWQYIETSRLCLEMAESLRQVINTKLKEIKRAWNS